MGKTATKGTGVKKKATKPPKNAKAASGRACSLCAKPGHNKRTCPKAK